MSEQEQKQTQPEPDVPFEEPAPGQEPEETPDPEPEETPDPEPPPAEPRGGAEQEAIYEKMDTKADNYFKGVRNLLEDSDIPVTVCEMCADAYPGVRWMEPRDDLHKTLLAVLGVGDGSSPLLADPDAQPCDRCGSLGWTKLPSFVPGNTERLCKKCNGAGWLDTNPQSGTLQPPVAAVDNGPAELMPGVPEKDPSVIDLRARGFTVIPPMQIAGAENA